MSSGSSGVGGPNNARVHAEPQQKISREQKYFDAAQKILARGFGMAKGLDMKSELKIVSVALEGAQKKGKWGSVISLLSQLSKIILPTLGALLSGKAPQTGEKQDLSPEEHRLLLDDYLSKIKSKSALFGLPDRPEARLKALDESIARHQQGNEQSQAFARDLKAVRDEFIKQEVTYLEELQKIAPPSNASIGWIIANRLSSLKANNTDIL